jgi:hypothetical protein
MTIFNKTLAVILTTLLWGVTCQAQVPSDNVVAYFPFNGDATDVTGNGNSTTYLTALTLTSDRLGQLGSAYYFNGSSSLIKLPNQLLPSNTAFAISCWVKIVGNHATADQSQTLIDLRGQYQIALSYFQSNYAANPSTFGFYMYSSPTAVTLFSPNNSAKLNIWQHVVASYGNNSMELYVDGNLIGTQTLNPPGTVSGYNNTIGKDYNVSLNRSWVNGSIDEVIFYKRKLTSVEVKAIYDRQIIQSQIPELYGPMGFTYDPAGNRTSRFVILLKSSKFINEQDSVNVQNTAQGQESMFEKDSLKYTDLDQKVKIYPNPTKGLLKTELSGFDMSLKTGIYVYNSIGTLLQQRVPATSTEIIDLSPYATGIYIMRIVVGDKVSEWKIIKE